MPKLQQTIEFHAKGINQLKSQMSALEKKTRELEASTKGVGGAGRKAGASFKSMAIAIGGSTVALLMAKKALSAIITTGKEFEQAMANVKAISGATTVEFAALEVNAKSLGASTKFTASEISGLQTEFAKLGFSAKEIVGVTKGTLALASAVGADLATAAAVSGATLRGFGLDVKETGRVTDVMAQSFRKSALDMSKFSDSMKYVAPIAKMAGVSLEGTSSILGQLANAGLDGSMAGTALRKILLEAGKEGSNLADRMGGPIKSFEDFQKKMKKLKDDGLDPMKEGVDLVGGRAVTAFGILLDGVDSVDKLHKSLLDAGGQAQKMAEVQLDTLEGKMTIMKSATEGLEIALFETFSNELKSGVVAITEVVQTLTTNLNLKTTAIDFTSKAYKAMGEEGQKAMLLTHIEALKASIALEKQPSLISRLTSFYTESYLPAIIETGKSLLGISAAQMLIEKTGIKMPGLEVNIEAVKELEKQLADAEARLKGLGGEIPGGEDAGTSEETIESVVALTAEYNRLNFEMENFMTLATGWTEESAPPFVDAFDMIRLSIFGSAQFTKAFAKEISNAKIVASKEIGGMLGSFASLNKASKGGFMVTARLQQAAAVANAYSAATAAIAPPPVGLGPVMGWVAFASALSSGLANVVQIESSLKEMTAVKAATGMDEIVSKPTMILAGEAGPESVNITPLGGGGEDTATAGSPINISISGNVLSQDYVEGELAESIKEAVRRGVSFGEA